jgi:hypothetical protein
MAQLVELSRTRSVTSSYVVTEDYTKKPTLCRSGVWVGLNSEFAETVVLSYEHDPEELYVGWSINGTTVIDPGYSAGTPPWGAPAPGDPSITYRCPVDGLFHRLSLSSTPGSEQECVWVRVLYRHPNEAAQPFHEGPSLSTCLSGAEVKWPPAKVKAEQACLAKFRELLRRYIEIAPPIGPGDPGPVERWLERVSGDDAIRVRALVEALEELSPEDDREVFEAIRADVASMVRWAQTPGGSGFRAPLARSPGLENPG